MVDPADKRFDDLLHDPRALFRLRVRRAARRALAEKGLRVSMDEIAAAAGVGRRSLFRHFASRDALIAEVLSEAVDDYHGALALETHEAIGDPSLVCWLEHLIARFHETVTEAGLAYWQLASANDDDLPPMLTAVNKRRRDARKASSAAIAREAWRRAGGPRAVPKIVVDAVALTMSAFTNRSMLQDYATKPAVVTHTTAALLSHLIDSEITARTRSD